MEKKDYRLLQNEYRRLKDCKKETIKGLTSYINKAIALYGNDFELKCDTHCSWQEKENADEFCALRDLPVCFCVPTRYDGVHEILPYRICGICPEDEFSFVKLMAWDSTDGEWVKTQELRNSFDNLQLIAHFVNAVLEQEMCNE